MVVHSPIYLPLVKPATGGQTWQLPTGGQTWQLLETSGGSDPCNAGSRLG